MKVYLDDERKTPEDWIGAKTAKEAIDYLMVNDVEEISLDHDLGDDPAVGTGYDVLLWIEKHVALYKYIPPIIHIHTSNPSARIKMELARKNILKLIKL